MFVILLLPIIANFIDVYSNITNKIFIKKARLKLENFHPKVIAITGSNGKTSVKNILLKMLETQYKTQATPESYNTPLGISLFINNNLKSDTEFLILEYGARHKSDIKKLCELFGADFGIVTNVYPQHLETFKSVENIFKEKNNLPLFLNKQLCVFNSDNLYTIRMYNQKSTNKISAGYNSKTYSIENIKTKNFKTSFDLILNSKKFKVKTKLLGEHNLSNIILSASLAYVLKIDPKNIIKAIENLNPTPHRLEYIKTNINILDDSYNCSISSAKQALNVFDNFPNKKMVVTPGIIEGGKQEKFLNTKLGEMCANADIVVIVGKHNKNEILMGLKNVNFTKKILFAKSLNDAKQYFKLLNFNDSLLLLNDLPDDYN